MEFKFQCPKCGFKSLANKDLSGRLKRCTKCNHNYTIAAMAADGTMIRHADPDPELKIEEVFAALHEWQKGVRMLPGAFAREVTFGHFEPAYRVTLQTKLDEGGKRVVIPTVKDTLKLPSGLAPAARTVLDLPFAHPEEVLPKLPSRDRGLRVAVQETLQTSVAPPNLHSRHLIVEHLSTWKAHWVYGELEGTAWFSGKPLKLHLSDPPKQSPLPMVAATILILAVVGGGMWAATKLGSQPPPQTVVVNAPAAPASLVFAKDGIAQLDDGGFRRGALERKDEAVLVGGQEAAGVVTVHLDAGAFLRGEVKRLEELEAKAKTAKDAKRETLVGLFLEVHRQREHWAKLQALCAPAELPNPAPAARLEAVRADVEILLEKSAPVVAAPVPAANPAAPAEAPKPAEISPAVRLAGDLLGQIMGAANDEARRRIAGGLEPLKAEKLPQGDLLHVATLWLGRSESDAGLIADRLHIKGPTVDSTYEGAFEKKPGEAYVHLKLPNGQDVTAYKEKDAWVAAVPGGIRLDGVQVTASPRAQTGSGERLREALDRLPPSRWMSAPAAEHLKAAKAAAASLDRKGTNTNDRGLGIVRALAAAHATTALRNGAPAEILEARTVLSGLGYAPSADGRWERADDRRAAQAGQLLKDSKTGEARSAGRGGADFAGLYRTAAILLLSPMRARDELDKAASAVENALGKACTAAESRHLQALKTAVAGFGICRDCGGGPAKSCTTCRGKGQRTEACAPCRGQGYIVTVGIGATGAKTCEVCGGKPIRGTRPCEKCEGKGTKSCPKCQGVAKLPVPTDLGRLSPCSRCNGSGGQGDLLHLPCPSCTGMGVQLRPAGSPDAILP